MTEQVHEVTDSTEDGQDAEPTFPASYVRELRQEAAEHRKRAGEAGKFRDALRNAVLTAHSAEMLREPLAWSDDYDDPETGLPDATKIVEAVQELAAAKPWLARPAGDIGTGFRGDASDTVSLADLLRAGA